MTTCFSCHVHHTGLFSIRLEIPTRLPLKWMPRSDTTKKIMNPALFVPVHPCWFPLLKIIDHSQLVLLHWSSFPATVWKLKRMVSQKIVEKNCARKEKDLEVFWSKVIGSNDNDHLNGWFVKLWTLFFKQLYLVFRICEYFFLPISRNLLKRSFQGGLFLLHLLKKFFL